jgi:hypothetical protein
MGRVLLLFFSCFLLNQKDALAQQRFPSVPDSFRTIHAIRVLPQNFYNQNLSFFCRKEVQLQKLTSLPLYIRAGSKDDVDYLEKKPNAARLPKQ